MQRRRSILIRIARWIGRRLPADENRAAIEAAAAEAARQQGGGPPDRSSSGLNLPDATVRPAPQAEPPPQPPPAQRTPQQEPPPASAGSASGDPWDNPETARQRIQELEQAQLDAEARARELAEQYVLDIMPEAGPHLMAGQQPGYEPGSPPGYDPRYAGGGYGPPAYPHGYQQQPPNGDPRGGAPEGGYDPDDDQRGGPAAGDPRSPEHWERRFRELEERAINAETEIYSDRLERQLGALQQRYPHMDGMRVASFLRAQGDRADGVNLEALAKLSHDRALRRYQAFAEEYHQGKLREYAQGANPPPNVGPGQGVPSESGRPKTWSEASATLAEKLRARFGR